MVDYYGERHKAMRYVDMLIKSNPKGVLLDWILYEVCKNYGVGELFVKKYCKRLESINMINNVGGNIVLVEKFKQPKYKKLDEYINQKG